MIINQLKEGKKIFDTEIAALYEMRNRLDDTFLQIVSEIIRCPGKIIWTGMGKSGHIARKNAATMASLGTPSFYLHPAEALHGDLGMISSTDVIIAISHSGESDEIIRMIPTIKYIGVKLIGMTNNANSSLALNSDIVQVLPYCKEAGSIGLAPTSSTTTALVYGDALAVVASEIKDFRQDNFGLFHPAGALGRKLLTKVSDIMVKETNKPIVESNVSLKDAIVELSRKGQGSVVIVKEGQICGILTDGDLRRALEKEIDVYRIPVTDIMTPNPICIRDDKLAVQALNLMKDKNVVSMPVINECNEYVGVVTLQACVRAL